MPELIAEDGGQRLHRQRLRDLIDNTKGTLRVASAYVTDRDLLIGIKNRKVCLLTSLLPMDIASGATSIEALLSLIESGVECRCLLERPRLHAKVYIFGSSSAVVTSANLTGNAFDSNIEVGVQIGAESVQELTAWFDKFWAKAHPLNVSQLAAWQQLTAALRRDYSKLRKRANAKLALPNNNLSAAVFLDDLRDLLENATRFFVCNTDRRYGGHDLERDMHSHGCATAWETFKFQSHIEQVEPGDAIFMFAKGIGIIGIGRAKTRCETLKPGARNRIRKTETHEWRVPVDWLDWRGDEEAYPYKEAPNFTFWNVTNERYRGLREGIRKHFLGGS